MNSKRRGLGKNISALLGESITTSAVEHTTDESELKEIPIDTIRRSPYQPRRELEPAALEELSQSIRAQGVIQPIVVRKISAHEYELVAGERRWRAAQLAGLEKIPALVREMSDNKAMAVALIENIQRENLNAIEEALALHRLINEFTMTHQQVAEAVGRSRVAVSNLLRLLGLANEVKDLLQKRQLEMGHARALLALSLEQQIKIAHEVIARQLSVRETETLIRKLQTTAVKQSSAKQTDPDILMLEKKLTEHLGTGVSIKHKTSGKGSITISYYDINQLEGILEKISS